MGEPESESRLIAAVEAGGTKFRAGLYRLADLTWPQPGGLAPTPVAETRVPTTDPATTLALVGDFLAQQGSSNPIAALGVASFGPLIVDRTSPAYGAMAATPKPGWTEAPILAALRDRLAVPADIQTDVEAAAVAEHRLGAGVGHDSVAYVTVGTGIGVGVVTADGIMRGRDHIELGHIFVDADPSAPTAGDGAAHGFGGTCPFHGDCLEGRASGVAIAERTGIAADALPLDHPIWTTVADELAQLACTIVWAFSPDRILFGGGVGANAHLEAHLRAATQRRLGGYSVSHADNDHLIATAGLGNDAGLVGAALLGASLL